MRFRNLSNIALDTEFWQLLAEPLALSGPLPGALSDRLGLYRGESLRVTIRPRLSRRTGAPDGTYTTGHISLFPCPKCSEASLLATYLHELFHAWLHQRNERVYLRWPHCDKADTFADAAYDLLGGRIRGPRCTQHELAVRRARSRLSRYAALCSKLGRTSLASLRRWSPNAMG
jgi:hypothetical protein